MKLDNPRETGKEKTARVDRDPHRRLTTTPSRRCSDVVRYLDRRLADEQKLMFFYRSHSKEAFNFLHILESYSVPTNCQKLLPFSDYFLTMSLKKTSDLLMHFAVVQSQLRKALLLKCQAKIRNFGFVADKKCVFILIFVNVLQIF